ncbi:MAG TPA: phosphatidylglycerol lysyltransferase domain-containing protein [Candidatus Paceibacterota bacterium]
MIPQFPNFKKIEFSDKEEVENITKGFPPYSDFNFTSIWIWDINEKMMFSELNNNLVVLFYDYVTNKPYLSFIGTNMISETTSTLLDYSKKKFKVKFLKLIPEEIAKNLPVSEFNAISDRDSHDYIYYIPNLANMEILQENSSGREIRQFMRKYPDYKAKDSSIQDAPKQEYEELFHRWARNKKIENCFEMNEYKAFQKMFEIKDDRVRVVSLYVDGLLVGFNVHEILDNDFVISHFAKYDAFFHRAIYDVLNWEEAKFLNSKGLKHFNWEQDLGILGLRQSKEKYKPGFFLEKFIVKSTRSAGIVQLIMKYVKNLYLKNHNRKLKHA